MAKKKSKKSKSKELKSVKPDTDKKVETDKKPAAIKSTPKKSNSWIYWVIAIVVVVLLVWAFQSKPVEEVENTPAPEPEATATPEPANESADGSTVVATVNGKEITAAELDETYDKLPPATKTFITKRQLLDTSINELLLLDKAEKLGITVTQEELDQYIQHLLSQEGITKEAFLQQANDRGIDEAEIYDLFRRRALIDDVIDKEIISKIEISDAETKTFYDENPDQFKTPEQIRASHILVETEEEANEVVGLLNDEGDFAELAKERSLDPGSGANGGDLGFFPKGVMVAPFEEAAFALNVGEVSAPVKSDFGYHVIKLVEKKEPSTVSYEEAKEAIKNSLMENKVKSTIETYMNDLKKEATININFNE